MDTTLLDDKDEMSRLVSSFRFAEVEFSTHWIQRLGSFSSTKCRSVFVADNTNDLVGDIPVYLFLWKYESQLGVLFPIYGKINMFQTINQW